jgi:hypothetical protein
MERRRQARTPVNINALLIGEKTVPKGCRVINVSQHGMMLYCDADGRLATFKAGDNVDIHLTVQHAGEQKKLTIPSHVRHVAENSVDVEFHHPDAILMDLIESYRISDQHKLVAALADNSTSTASVTPISNTDFGSSGASPNHPGQTTAHATSYRPFYMGLLSLILALCIITGGYVYTASIDSRISTLEAITERQSDTLSDLQNRAFSTSLQEGRYASLNARMTALGDAFAHLEDKLILLIPESTTVTGTDGIPAVEAATAADSQQPILITPPEQETAAIGKSAAANEAEDRLVEANIETVKVSSDESDTAPDNAAGKTLAPATTEQDVVADEQTGEVAGNLAVSAPAQTEPPDIQALEATASTTTAERAGTAAASTTPESSPAPSTGPWTINLLSSPDKAYVEQVASRARAQDFDVVISAAEVKGRQYWRLQIPGFNRSADAKDFAEPVKQALGIKDVWILKKK